MQLEKIKIDTRNLKNDLIDPGQYPAQVAGVRRMGKNTYVVSFYILDSDDSNEGEVLTTLGQKIQTDVAGQKKLKRFLEAIKEDVPTTGEFETDPNQWIGQYLLVDVRTVMPEGSDDHYNEIRSFVSIDEEKSK
jgi:hypothetical protein